MSWLLFIRPQICPFSDQVVGRGWWAENKSGGLKNEEIWVGLGARTVIGIKPREFLQVAGGDNWAKKHGK